jgi:hypothetical protein
MRFTLPRIALAVSLVLAAHATRGEPHCTSVLRDVDGIRIDLAPLEGFVEICSRDKALCRTLTAGYPASVNTLGYFVTAGEWEAYKGKRLAGFTRYLIAQLAGTMSPEDLPGFKSYIHSQQGDVPDHTRLPETLKGAGRSSLGVFDETADSISFGTIMKLQTAVPGPWRDAWLASTNSALVAKRRVLSLYAFAEVRRSEEVEEVKEMTKSWLRCLRKANDR